MTQPANPPRRDLLAILRQREEDRKADREAGRVRVGGDNFYVNVPEYVQSYVQASRALIDEAIQSDRLQAMAMPCVYLVRHALELTLKDILAEVYAIQGMTVATITRSATTKAPMGHNLGGLLTELVKQAATLHVKIPKVLSHLVTEVHEFEDGDPTRCRYGMGMGDKYRVTSFPDEVVIPVLDWQERLEHVWAAHLGVRSDVVHARKAPENMSLAEARAQGPAQV